MTFNTNASNGEKPPARSTRYFDRSGTSSPSGANLADGAILHESIRYAAAVFPQAPLVLNSEAFGQNELAPKFVGSK
jgi:hypothetical protein